MDYGTSRRKRRALPRRGNEPPYSVDQQPIHAPKRRSLEKPKGRKSDDEENPRATSSSDHESRPVDVQRFTAKYLLQEKMEQLLSLQENMTRILETDWKKLLVEAMELVNTYVSDINDLKVENQQLKEENISLKRRLEEKTLKNTDSEVCNIVTKPKEKRVVKTKESKESTLQPEAKKKLLCAIPKDLYQDPRIADVLRKIRKKSTSETHEIKFSPKGCSEISKSDVLLVPCVVESRLESDIGAVMSRLDLSAGQKILLLIFHHKSPHINFSPSSQSSLQSSLQRWNAVAIDFLFWNKEFYDCRVNDNGCKELIENLTSGV